MMKIGITGSIGSGKTTVCKAFEALGVPVYYADNRAIEILEQNRKVISAVKKLFGKNIYDTKGRLKRKEVAQIVFSNKQKLKQYNALVHPVVLKNFERWAKKQKNVSYILKEAALLFEAGADKELDFVICVTAPEKLRIQRVMHRDGVKKADVLKRMKNQMSQKEKLSRSLLQIRNDGKTSLTKQVYDIHEAILMIGKK
jgi:dephospho-CoA kinase